MIYVAIGMNVWGKAATVEDAVKNIKHNDPRCTTYYVREYMDGSNPRVDSVDGSIWFDPVGDVNTSRLVLKVKNGKIVEDNRKV